MLIQTQLPQWLPSVSQIRVNCRLSLILYSVIFPIFYMHTTPLIFSLNDK